MRLGILPARIDKYLVLAAPGLSHCGYRRAEHATDRRVPFTGFGACLARLICSDATKPPIDRQSTANWSALIPSQEPNSGQCTSLGRISALRYLSGLRR
jgi:hypothetical protein